ncbi:MAG: tRNA (adenosine(37)-N6)-threonylcarbamoyltransferase complex dimerization subunit type 1 TsaB [Fusobacteriaceae bacterium]|nr:tRNA (adenosine(37)-N6)-threonylcarbamoyltransferase complex dimerization subunit type 1 TsaB [Fusobacteriaceae bacterium]MBU9917881.1 tRNA (adenosine(37)-N6)-threonylcarbamoyltransferase complex dimerization subunit type 1 TsaB [Fusobacteriaceae bacterium]
MLILGIDTSTKVGSVALFDDKKGVLAEVIINTKSNHSDTIMNAIDYILNLADCSVDDLDKVAVTVGPGSFTGIRIGIAIAKALVFKKDIKMTAMNTLDLLAYETAYKGKILSLIDARKERAYYALYENMEKISEYSDGELREFLEKYKEDEILFTGDASYIYKEIIEEIMGSKAKFINKARVFPRAGILAERAVDLEEVNSVILEPYYHSKTQAEREKELKSK